MPKHSPSTPENHNQFPIDATNCKLLERSNLNRWLQQETEENNENLKDIFNVGRILSTYQCLLTAHSSPRLPNTQHLKAEWETSGIDSSAGVLRDMSCTDSYQLWFHAQQQSLPGSGCSLLPQLQHLNKFKSIFLRSAHFICALHVYTMDTHKVNRTSETEQ